MFELFRLFRTLYRAVQLAKAVEIVVKELGDGCAESCPEACVIGQVSRGFKASGRKEDVGSGGESIQGSASQKTEKRKVNSWPNLGPHEYMYFGRTGRQKAEYNAQFAASCVLDVPGCTKHQNYKMIEEARIDHGMPNSGKETEYAPWPTCKPNVNGVCANELHSHPNICKCGALIVNGECIKRVHDESYGE